MWGWRIIGRSSGPRSASCNGAYPPIKPCACSRARASAGCSCGPAWRSRRGESTSPALQLSLALEIALDQNLFSVLERTHLEGVRKAQHGAQPAADSLARKQLNRIERAAVIAAVLQRRRQVVELRAVVASDHRYALARWPARFE